MPGLDGLGTVALIKDVCQAENLNLPYMCCCTAYEDQAFKKNALENGMQNLLVKPIIREQLQTILYQLNFTDVNGFKI